MAAGTLAVAQAAASPVLNRVHEPVILLMDVLIVAGIIGLWSARACGTGWPARVGLGLTTLGMAVAVPAELLGAFRQPISRSIFQFVVTPADTIGLLLAGIAMIVARRWSGWRRFTLLASGIWYPFFALSHVLVRLGTARYLALAIWGLCLLALGLAMRAEARKQPHEAGGYVN